MQKFIAAHRHMHFQHRNLQVYTHVDVHVSTSIHVVMSFPMEGWPGDASECFCRNMFGISRTAIKALEPHMHGSTESLRHIIVIVNTQEVEKAT